MDWQGPAITALAGIGGYAAKAMLEKINKASTEPQIKKATDSFKEFLENELVTFKANLSSELTTFKAGLKDEILKGINGTYVRSAGSSLTGAEIERRFVRVETDTKEIDTYAHDSRHELANSINVVTAKLAALHGN